MPSQVISSVENNFTKGLVTEFTGLNFPENAATDTDNCEYTIVGNVIRRQGINAEANGSTAFIDRTGVAVSSYKWNNVGGDGLTQIVVRQVGGTLHFYKSSAATSSSPLSTTKMSSTVGVAPFVAFGGVFDSSVECQFADGNGYLFVYHPSCDPFYCTYTAGTGLIVATAITIKIRDFAGITENVDIFNRPTDLTQEHLYNLVNQGWTKGSQWQATSSSGVTILTANIGFTVASGITGINVGDQIRVQTLGYITGPHGEIFTPNTPLMNGNVISYSGTSLLLNITYAYPAAIGLSGTNWLITPTNVGYINTWNTGLGNYPSNADVWWTFKDTSQLFNPATTSSNTSLGSGPAPKGHTILNAFTQSRSVSSGITGLTDISTTVRPRTGCWFQGRVWYAGVDSAAPSVGDADFTTWTESIYFSQIVTKANQFGQCYQTNDPTSETLFGLLPSDGGVIQIQGCGSVYKLFPLQNAMLIFAANGVWYLTGSSGIGFTANDYTIVKLSSTRSISSTSFVDVQGLPMFWNEEGIYKVEPAKQGTQLLNSPLHVNPLEVSPVTVGTILSFYDKIPLSSKKYAKAAYHPIDYVVQWVYRDTDATDVTGRYTYNKILNYNVYNKAFFPYTVDTSTSSINGLIYVEGPGGSNSPPSTIKYVYSNGTASGFAEEYDTNYVDWGSINYSSYFITGYKLHGQAEHRFQVPYIYVYSNLDNPVSYYIQSLWDYATSGNSGRWSTQQQVNIFNPNFSKAFRRHRLRGQGLVMQIKISSVDGKPFDIQGWALYETMNQGV